ncbi:hypothetical protein DFA_02177 [Cavenderia fasciculata]|uniref:Kynurenine formamidase n=1 Tax=Cavenderia fasciculata TaxID=261658 RepID=F4PYC3_CACFS|nr:uncharacterized protein DFA_02177 [Cavenderia fasciculata]EGG19390.1 hypothetical protein DFA_02177 [Cavenderia fasciculata]|eukprot:XP_004357661.1 hypothetical protein DFA_02177 [Cavenderia fasciculata]
MDKTAIYYDIAYATQHSSQKMDIYEPSLDGVEPGTLFPLMVYVHGGFWMDRDKSDYLTMGRYFASKGIVVAVVNYRLSKKAHKVPVRYPTHNQDLAQAISWLVDNQSDYRYDSNNIHLVGHSCGAHMISMIALKPTDYLTPSSPYTIRSCIGIQGIYDISQLIRDYPDYISEIEFVFNSSSDWEAPQQIVSHGRSDYNASLKWLIVHAPTDQLVNPPQSSNFVTHLSQQCKYTNVESFTDAQGSHFAVVMKLGEEEEKSLDNLRSAILTFIK